MYLWNEMTTLSLVVSYAIALFSINVLKNLTGVPKLIELSLLSTVPTTAYPASSEDDPLT